MKSTKIVSTIECRMTSSRLAGKVMMKSMGKPMLAYLVERLSQVSKIEEIILATTTNPEDDCIEILAKELGIKSFRGSENDVLSRVLGAAKSVQGDIIVEITGDCPLIDSEIVSQTLELYLTNNCDYASNCFTQSYPMGMETQVFSTKLLERADQEGNLQEDREHVSWYFVRNPEMFRILNLPAPQSLSYPNYRLTLDETEDFELIDRIIRSLYEENRYFSCLDIIKLLEKNPDWTLTNQKIVQRTPGG